MNNDISHTPASQPNGALGGSLEDAVAGHYAFTIGGVIQEAWERTKGLKGPFWGGAVLLFFGLVAVSFVLGLVLGRGHMSMGGSMLVPMLSQLLITIVLYPCMAGIFMMGVRRSVDQPISFQMLFGYFPYLVPLVIAGILMTVLMMLGFVLLIIPGIYLAVGYSFTIPLIVEKNLGAWEAMETSRKAVTRHWFKIFFLYLVMTLIFIISAIPLGIGIIWTYPMFVAMIGVMYREMFGVAAE
jgi:uncharacterized membrane protein